MHGRSAGAAPPNDASWTAGTTGIGYDYDGLVGLDVGAMKSVNPSAYARIPFTIADQASLDSWNRLPATQYFGDRPPRRTNDTTRREEQSVPVFSAAGGAVCK